MTTQPWRVAAITGAAQGIGRRTAEVLAAEGFALAVLDRQPVTGLGPDVLTHAGDVSSEADVAAFAAAVVERFGRIDVLVNNAGIACMAPAEATAPDVAQAVAFLADPARSGFVNGATLSVDGGWAADGSWPALRLAARAR